MFDKHKPQDPTNAPEDMFKDMDSVPQVTAPTSGPVVTPSADPQPPATLPVQETMSPPPAPMQAQVPMQNTHGMNWKPLLIVLFILIVVAVGATLGYLLLVDDADDGFVDQDINDVLDEADFIDPLDALREEEQEAQTAPVQEPLPPADADKDGLTDEEEAALGTSSRTPDTDADGLFDYEEVNTYRTNPLNPDTDGDGFTDGEEVKNGYDPAGPGRLTGLPPQGS